MIYLLLSFALKVILFAVGIVILLGLMALLTDFFLIVKGGLKRNDGNKKSKK